MSERLLAHRLTLDEQCRAMFFPTIKEATTFWVKGEKFSIAKLLGESYKPEYDGGSMCIFRLAPQDYHRFHSPVDGVIGKYSKIGAQYYTGSSFSSLHFTSCIATDSNRPPVNPQGVRSASVEFRFLSILPTLTESLL